MAQRLPRFLAPVLALGALAGCGDGPSTSPSGIDVAAPLVERQGLGSVPVNTLPPTQTTNEDSRLDLDVAGVNALSVANADGGNIQVQITVTNGTFTVEAPPPAVSVAGNGTSTVILTGPVVDPLGLKNDINGALDDAFYQPANNFNGTATLQMNSADTDGDVDNDVLQIVVTAFNDPPVNSVPIGALQPATEDVPRAFSIAVNDVDVSDADIVAISLSTNSSTVMTLPLTTGLTFSVGDGNADALMTFTGTLANINSALNGLTVTAAPNFVGQSTLTITSNDQGRSGAGGPGSDTDTLTIDWTAVNDAPVNRVPGPRTVNEEASTTFAAQALAVDDIDGPTTLVQVTLSATGGTVSLSGTSQLEFTAGDGAADPTMTFSGTLSALNAALNNAAFTPNTDFVGTAVLSMVANDLGNSGNGGAKQDSDSVSITVTAVNDAPANIMPPNQFASEDVVLSLANANRIRIVDVDAPALQTTLTVSSGTLTLPVKAGLVFQVGDGTTDTTTTFTGAIDAVNRALDGLQFLGNTNASGPVTLTIVASDLGATGTGGTLTDTDAITIDVSPVNDAPDAQNDARTVAEDSAETLIAVLANDTILPDVNETLSVTAVGQPLNGTVRIVGTQVGYIPNANFAGTDTFAYTISDGILTDTANVVVTVTNVNDAPTANADSFFVPESTPTTLNVLSNDTAAPDVGETLTVTAVTQPQNGIVSINAGGTTLNYAPTVGFVGSDAFTYTLSDGSVLTATGSVAITVNDVNTTPVNTLPGPQTTSEDSPLIFVAGGGNALTVNDTNNANLEVRISVTSGTYSLGGVANLTVSGNNTATVTAQGTIAALNTGLNNGRFTPAANFNGAATLTMTTSDTDGESDTDSLTITVTPVNDLPVNIVPTGPQAATEDTPRTFINVSISDVDIGGAQALITLTANNDTVISLSTVTGLTFAVGDGAEDGTMRFTGNLVSINTALNGLTVTSPPGFIGNSDLDLTTNDQAGGVVTSTIGLVWSAVNDPPVNTAPEVVATNEETAVTLNGANVIRIADVDVAASLAQVSVTASTGTITLSGITGLTFTVGDGTNDTTTTFSGTLTNLNLGLDGLRFTPPTNFVGAATLTVVTSDLGNSGAGGVRTDTDVITINVGGVNDAPVNNVPGIAQLVNEDTNRIFSAGNGNLITVTDVDASAVQISLSGDNGVVSLANTVGLSFQAGDGTADATMTFTGTVAAANAALANITWRPNQDFNGDGSLTVLTSDLGGSGAGGTLIDNDTIAIRVAPINDPPAADNDAVLIDEDPVLAVTIPVLANDTFAPDANEVLAITSVSTPSNGSATINGTAVTYRPNANFFGADSFTYVVRDGNGGVDTGTVVVTVTPVNDVPVANADSFSLGQNAGATRLNVLSNDTSAPDVGETLSITAVTQPASGTAVIVGGTAIDYTPNQNFTGSDSLVYTLSDGTLATTALVSIDVFAINSNPVNTLPPPQTTTEDTPLTFRSGANPMVVTDANSANLTVLFVVSSGTFKLGGVAGLTVTGDGTANVTADGTLAALNTAFNNAQYRPTPNFNGAATLTMTANDTDGFFDTDTLTITVTSANDAPINTVPTAIEAAVEDTPRSFGNISVADADIGGGQLLMTLTASDSTVITIGTDGLQFLTGDGTNDATMQFIAPVAAVNAALNGLTVTSPANFIGQSTLVINTSDQGNTGVGGARSDEDTITINWVSDNDFPVNTVPGPQAVDEDQPLLFSGANQTAIRVSDVDAAGALLNVTITTTNGTLTLADPGLVAFTGFVGAAGDGVDDATMTFRGSVANTNLALEGATWRPNAGFSGAAQLTITTNDNGNTGGGGARTDVDTLAITVNAVNDAPVLTAPGDQAIGEDELLNFSAADATLISVSDVDAAILQVALTATNATATLRQTSGLTFQAGNGNGNATMIFRGSIANINSALSVLGFRPTANFNGPANLTIDVDDLGATGIGGVQRATASIDVQVGSTNDLPVVTADVITIVEDAGPTIINVLGNDTSVPDLGETLVIVALGAVANGTASTDGVTVTYRPNPDFAGTERFTYTVSDGLATVQAQVTVTVTGVNDAPVAVDDTFAVGRNAAATTLAVLGNDLSAPDIGEILRITATTTAAHGTVGISANTFNVIYTPEQGYEGPDAFEYTLSDGNGGTDTALVTINVAVLANAVPVAANDARTVVEDSGPVTIDILANDSGLADAPLTVVLTTQPSAGTAVLQANNTVLWTPPADFSGVVSFDYRVTDVDDESATASITITVNAINDAPRVTADTATVDEDTSVNIAVLANDESLGDPPTTLTIATGPTNGTVVVEDDDTVTYTPNPDFNGTDTFTYVLADADQTATTQVVVTVTPVADAPDAVADVAAGRTGEPIDINVLANDLNVDGDVLVVTVTTPPASGEATVVAGRVRYIGAAAFTGTDQFVYTVTNAAGLTDTASVVVGVGIDTDSDGLIDIDEPRFGTDPAVADTDGDLIPDGLEVTVTGTDPNDDDSDEDGLLDSSEDIDRDGLVGAGESDATAFDTDGDGISDGVERGVAAPEGDDTDLGLFRPDEDPTTTTDPTSIDTDGDGFIDGGEDSNRNGRLDAGEFDPTVSDTPEPEPEPEGCTCGTTSPANASLVGFISLVWLLRRRRRAA